MINKKLSVEMTPRTARAVNDCLGFMEDILNNTLNEPTINFEARMSAMEHIMEIGKARRAICAAADQAIADGVEAFLDKSKTAADELIEKVRK